MQKLGRLGTGSQRLIRVLHSTSLRSLHSFPILSSLEKCPLLDKLQVLERTWGRKVYSGCTIADGCLLQQFPRKLWAVKDHMRSATGSALRKVDTNYKSASSFKLKPQSDPRDDVKLQPVVYEGSFSDTLSKVKRISIIACCLSVVTGPVFTFFLLPQVSIVWKGGIASCVTLFSLATTVAVHWLFGPYVHKLTWKPGEQGIELELLSWMGTVISKSIWISDIRPPKSKHPFASFAVQDQLYYVDAEQISDMQLLRMLTFYRNQI